MEKLTFEDLPNAVSLLIKEVAELKEIILNLKSNEVVEPDKLLSIKEAGEFLNLSVPTIYSKVSKGEIPVMKQGKRLYFSRTELHDFIKAGKNKTTAEIEAEADAYFSSSKVLHRNNK